MINGTPRRIAVYDLALLDIVDALGVTPVLLPDTTLPASLAHLEQVPGLTKAGTLFEPDLQALAAAQPDLILIGSRSAKHQQALAGIAPTLELGSDRLDFSNSILATTLSLGRVLDRQVQARKLAIELLQQQERLAGQLAGQRAASLFVVNGRIALHAPGERFGIFHDLTGLAATSAAVTEETPRASGPQQAAAQEAANQRLQAALAAGPQWLFVLDRASATGGQEQARAVLAADPAVTATPAWKAGQVVWLDPADWYLVTGGVRPAQALLQQLAP